MSNERAAESYNRSHKQGGQPRQTEGRALLEAARRMAEAQQAPEDSKALRDAARLNWRLWTIFQAELSAPESQVPVEIRQNMLNLCNFVDKRTVDILAEPKAGSFDVLININRQIAAGLLTDPAKPEGEAPAEGGAPPPSPGGGISV